VPSAELPLMEDLQNRGMLDETLVVVHSEMGRGPRINKDAGREHWTHCYSVMLAGAGIRGGTVQGASDAQAALRWRSSPSAKRIR
jgi:uncharacterized protein (DUF1501 family)